MKLFALNKERWTGSFTYQLEDEHGISVWKVVAWVMEIELDQDGFRGTRVDEETKDLFGDQVVVEGFKEGDEISFIVKYPSNYYSDLETGEIISLPDEEHPGVLYSGSYDHETREYSGEWEVKFWEESIGRFQKDFYEHSMVGIWKMKKEPTPSIPCA